MHLPHFRAVPVFFPLAFTVLIAACSSPEPGPPTQFVSQFQGLLPLVMENDSGLLHGIELGMTPEQVKHFSGKADSLSLQDNGTLLFERHLTPKEEFYYECNFDDQGLHTITLDVHLKDRPNADSLFADFKNYFNLKYGPPFDTSNVDTWLLSGGKRPAKIQLIQEPDYSYGKLTVVFFDKSFDPLPPTVDTLVPTADSMLMLQ